MSDRPYVIDQMISAKSIAARVEALAREISAHFQGCDKLVVVGLLRGSFVFIADLVREIDLPVEVDFLEASSYGNAMESSREVRILKDLRGEIAGRDVLVVEDIVDTGFTLSHVVRLLKSREPRRLEVCALLDKPTAGGADPRRTGPASFGRIRRGLRRSTSRNGTATPYIGKVSSPKRNGPATGFCASGYRIPVAGAGEGLRGDCDLRWS
jgi:hypoxanthine phosphoribosyltransferase